MRVLACLLFLTVQLSCAQKKNNPEIKENINENSMNNIGVCNVPDELKSNIDSSIVFAMSSISRFGAENIANILYLLDDKRTFTRITNTENPGDRLLFSTKKKEYSTIISESKYSQFIQYLDSINSPDLVLEYKTPDNLEVMDGTNDYVFIRSSNNEKWLCFEPESGEFIKQIQKKFNMIFE